jgi:hypothetical protein
VVCCKDKPPDTTKFFSPGAAMAHWMRLPKPLQLLSMTSPEYCQETQLKFSCVAWQADVPIEGIANKGDIIILID